MEEHENLYEKIREILGDEPGRMKILDQQIDLELQGEYYNCSERLQSEVDEQWAMDRTGFLHEPGYPEKMKKEILARLATIDRVECYRMIEAYTRIATGSLSDWSFLALNESRLRLESGLLG